ncbi:MAG: class I SAM-dependent methyltransferase [Anaerolineae bacterium]|nr:class I SAM-dependent methyltransferase [Anaerolineae bacterium]
MNNLPPELENRLNAALMARADWTALADHRAAFRLFNGFYEGQPGLTLDIYARTLLISYLKPLDIPIDDIQAWAIKLLPWLESVLFKSRVSGAAGTGVDRVLFGRDPDTEISENDCLYAINLRMNQDASFYLDTRELRKWLKQQCSGWSVLNTFAYTGSLGVAALAGGAARVVQVDLSKKFLGMALNSCNLNHFETKKMRLMTDDFFSATAALKRSGELFDCVILDPPFFSSTHKGRVNLVTESGRLINKIRPLVKHDGYLISINNALFLSGADYKAVLDDLCRDGYMEWTTMMDVPPDCCGYPETINQTPPADPAPFNHPTKIAILKIKRKNAAAIGHPG